MQGATVERATVVAHPHDLTAGWSYTALSRARERTTLLIHDEEPDREHQPAASAPAPARTLDRVAQRMRVRDDEDLAVEQLPPAGHHDDLALTAAERSRTSPPQERAGQRAEPAVPNITPARLREVQQQERGLRSQFDALPRDDLARLETVQSNELSLQTQRDHTLEKLRHLPPAPRLRRDRHADERVQLISRLNFFEHALAETRELRTRQEAGLGSPEQIRSELDGLHEQIRSLARERHELIKQLSADQLAQPSPWITQALGPRPVDHNAHEWDKAAGDLTRYRVEHHVGDQTEPLGPEPASREERSEWQRAHAGLDRVVQRLGRERGHDVGMEIDL
jgi:hypothetical protein